jgi:NAD(P)-dependent dehydrogenase (short-subunit alcohol dehydrogenase family)
MSPPSPPVAIVTGAGTGIGRAVAALLAGAGYGLALVGRRRETLQDTADAIGAPAETLVVPADLARPEAAGRVVDAVLDRWGRVDALVNNAGAAPLVPIDETTEDLLGDTFAINTFTPIRLVARLWPVFCRQRSGCVVNVSSMAAADPFPGFAVYAASKGAVEALTRSVINEGRQHGIRAYSVAPGAVETPLLRSRFDERAIPPEHALDPGDVARVIVDCVMGRREADLGRTIPIPSP